VVESFPHRYHAHWLAGVRRKLGVGDVGAADADVALANDWLALLAEQAVDFTTAWRRLADAAAGDLRPLESLFDDTRPLAMWLDRWAARCAPEPTGPAERASAMRLVNPIYIPRNQRVEDALTAASEDGDLRPFNRLLDVVSRPFDERPGLEEFAAPAPPDVTAGYRTFCGT
jgi:uncharacterized protein YdiU (UPF0061 family)